jgi:hypothetical protein
MHNIPKRLVTDVKNVQKIYLPDSSLNLFYVAEITKALEKSYFFYFNKMDVSLKNNTRLQNFTKPTKHKEDFNFTHKNFFIKSSKKLVPKPQI